MFVAHSKGKNLPRFKTPLNACDAHIHLYEENVAYAGNFNAQGMTLENYRLLQKRLGVSRAVIVQSKPQGVDNDYLLKAISAFNGKARGIAVVFPDVSDNELQKLHKGGVRGLRFSVWNTQDTVTRIEMIEPLAKRIAPLGWHVQLHISGAQIVEHEAMISRLPCPIVIDHLGRLPLPKGVTHLSFEVIAKLFARDDVWMKLSGAYLNTVTGEPYVEATKIAKALVKLEPSRFVWGSDWPHITEKSDKPNDALLLDLLYDWAGSEELAHKILVDNPAQLYGF